MTKPRKINDGLPFRVYERHGLKTYSVGYKRKDGKWAFRMSCPVGDQHSIKRLRRDATRRALSFSAAGSDIETIAHLVQDWFSWQEGLPLKSLRKRAESTMEENAREVKNLLSVFGDMAIVDIQPHSRICLP